MPYPNPTEPVRGPAAFAQETDEAALSRAAVLLHVAGQIRGDDVALAARRERMGRPARSLVPAYEKDDLPVPVLRPTSDRFSVAPRAELLRESVPADRAELGRELYANPSPRAAASLARACLTDRDELTRVAAAALDFLLSTNPRPSVETLARGTASGDELVREVAATALARISPRHPSLGRLYAASASPGQGEPSRTSLLVHGTFARSYTWWMPGGDFHQYLLGIRPDLYGAPDRFDWSGRYSEAARAEAAVELLDWIAARDLDGLSLFTHSHGGSVAMLATQGALTVGELVLLSCPVHPEYAPNFANVSRTVSVRVKWDLVILADGGGQRFDDPRIEEHVLPIWFNHSATHSPGVWATHHVDLMI
jgi:hypothetical protein